MRYAHVAPLLLATLITAATPHNRAVLPLAANPNTVAAGTLRDGVLTLELEAQDVLWSAAGAVTPMAHVEAFAERGKQPSAPGPLIRVPAGTLVRVSVRNTLARSITVFLPTSATADDSVVVAAGAVGELQVRAAKPGNYLYRATTSAKIAQRVRIAGVMTGAMVVDSPDAPPVRGEQVMVLMMTPDSLVSAEMESGKTLGASRGTFAFTINGLAWPNTERVAASVGDTLHWRVINASFDVHPMHLHGFYFRIDDFSGPAVERDGQAETGGMVVTQRMSPFSTMSTTWVPEKPGNWLFHCHFAIHLAPDAGVLRDAETSGRPVMQHHEENHALTGMIGLVVGITVAPQRGALAAATPRAPRRLRLLVVSDSGFPAMRPSFRFVIEEKGRQTTSSPGFSPTLNLRRNEPVAITVVNRLAERTAVHWHGMELESYFDGVAGLSGVATRLAPTIAPGDSFVARFTPPRSGTFMYHSHVDDVRQQPAGLVGAMIVRDGALTAQPDDHEIFLKGARDAPIGTNPLEVGGSRGLDTIVAHVGKPMRLRFMNLTAISPNATVTLTSRPDSSFLNLADTMVVQWTPLAKDGADRAPAARVPKPARVLISMGETYDFEFLPQRRGQQLRIEVRGAAITSNLLARIPVKVE